MLKNRAPIPSVVRRTVLKRANGQCEDCGEHLPLELHHLTYWIGEPPPHKYAQPIFGHETEDDLLALCRGCHLDRHVAGPFGEFFADPEDVEAEDSYWDHVVE